MRAGVEVGLMRGGDEGGVGQKEEPFPHLPPEGDVGGGGGEENNSAKLIFLVLTLVTRSALARFANWMPALRF